MAKRGGKRKKKSRRDTPKNDQQQPAGPLSKWGGNLRLSIDATMIVLGIMQLTLGMVLLSLLANFYNPSVSNPLAPTAQQVAERPDRPFSPLVAYGYAIYTFCLWTLLFSRRRRMGERQARFITVLFLPGTLMAVWVLYRFFAAVSGGG